MVQKKKGKKAAKKTVKKTTMKASKFADVAPEHNFVCCNGRVLTNLSQVPAAIKSLSGEEFKHHVSEERHDFANWIEFVYKKKTLAKQARKELTKTGLTKLIKSKL